MYHEVDILDMYRYMFLLSYECNQRGSPLKWLVQVKYYSLHIYTKNLSITVPI